MPAATRAPLPRHPDDAPPLPEAFGAALDALLPHLPTLAPAARAGIEAHVRLLLAWNAAINLTAVRDPGAVALEHVADSIVAVDVLTALGVPPRPRIVDLGSGGGFPGLPLALALPASEALLVDSIGKKARFLAVAAAAAEAAARHAGGEPPAMHAAATRAEAVAERRDGREAFDVAVVRAVGPLDESAELGLPLVRVGGRLVAWKRDDGTGRLADEVDAARPLVARLGGAVESVEPVTVPGLTDHRLIVLDKRRPTPGVYPRPPAARRTPDRRR